jgi:glycosyltransferase involved in cell wall biosynthesis
MDLPLISIIMSVRNGADTIKETIDSVTAQTYQNWELLIRDNCSSDRTIDIIKSFKDARIYLTVNSRDRGSLYNQLLLSDAAKGEYIKLIDDDSYLYPACLEQEARVLLDHADAAAVTCGTEYVTPDGKIIPVKIPFKAKMITRGDYIKYTLLTARGSIQEGNQMLYRADFLRSSYDRLMAAGIGGGLVNAYSAYFYIPAAVLSNGNLYVIHETLSAGRIDAASYSLKFNQAKLQPAWIELLRQDGCKMNPFLYILARVMIIARSTARSLAFRILGRQAPLPLPGAERQGSRVVHAGTDL